MSIANKQQNNQFMHRWTRYFFSVNSRWTERCDNKLWQAVHVFLKNIHKLAHNDNGHCKARWNLVTSASRPSFQTRMCLYKIIGQIMSLQQNTVGTVHVNQYSDVSLIKNILTFRYRICKSHSLLWISCRMWRHWTLLWTVIFSTVKR